MHLFDTFTLVVITMLVGVEFSVSAFVNPAAWRLAPEAQAQMLGRFAYVLGKVMPVWYPACAVLLVLQTWLHWHTAARNLLLLADALWVLASVASIFFLVPLNNQIVEGAPGWQQIHRVWDRRHRVRVAVLAAAAILLTYALVP